MRKPRARVLLLLALALVMIAGFTVGFTILAHADKGPLPGVFCQSDAECRPPANYICCNGDCRKSSECNQQ